MLIYYISNNEIIYVFFSVKENPVIAHQWIISLLQMDCFHALISGVIRIWYIDWRIVWSFTFNALNAFNIKKMFENMIIIWDQLIISIRTESN